MTDATSKQPVHHLLGLSCGKGNCALEIYLCDRILEMEYFFADTGVKLPETLKFFDLLESYFGKPIARLNFDRNYKFI